MRLALPLLFVLAGWAMAEPVPVNLKNHPAYASIASVKAPTIRGQARTDIDRFILKSLEDKRISMNPEAKRVVLIRRVAFDLTGLPPTPAAINEYLADKSADAYEKMVDRYLASPKYGERWGKFWLDAAGYADSNGYFNADSDRPLAWRYRDYVIRSFNDDKPYDRFVREQLAGDELVNFSPEGDVTPAMVDPLIATHFLRNAPDGSGESDGNPDEVLTDRFTVLEGNIQNVMNCLLGLTVQCARCHDHKFEPITQKEYYSLQAILFPVYNPDHWTKPNERVVKVGTKSELAAAKRLNEIIDRQVNSAKDGLVTFGNALREQVIEERLQQLDPAKRLAVIEAWKAAKEKRTAPQQILLKTHEKDVTVSDDELAKRFAEFSKLRELVKQTVDSREKSRPKQPETLSIFTENDPNPPAHHLLKRGQHNAPGEAVSPGVLAVLSNARNAFEIKPVDKNKASTGRRSAFAQWVTSPENPLFARTMANRIWQHHFGNGLVATADNLGASGAKPSHPELLDYLASEFKAGGWSIKRMHRLIMHSAVYRQSSAPRDFDDINGDNWLLAKFPLRRLDSEAIRDSMLFVSGELNEAGGGPYVPSQRTAEGTVEISENPASRKRSVYVQQRRTQVVTFLQLFDSPTIVSTCGKRSPSTVPLQSLALLNSEFARLRSKAFAERLSREAGGEESKRLTLAFQIACGRTPLKDELELCTKFLATQRSLFASAPDAEIRAWTDLCQMVLASNAFLYIE